MKVKVTAIMQHYWDDQPIDVFIEEMSGMLDMLGNTYTVEAIYPTIIEGITYSYAINDGTIVYDDEVEIVES